MADGIEESEQLARHLRGLIGANHSRKFWDAAEKSEGHVVLTEEQIEAVASLVADLVVYHGDTQMEIRHAWRPHEGWVRIVQPEDCRIMSTLDEGERNELFQGLGRTLLADDVSSEDRGRVMHLMNVIDDAVVVRTFHRDKLPQTSGAGIRGKEEKGA